MGKFEWPKIKFRLNLYANAKALIFVVVYGFFLSRNEFVFLPPEPWLLFQCWIALFMNQMKLIKRILFVIIFKLKHGRHFICIIQITMVFSKRSMDAIWFVSRTFETPQSLDLVQLLCSIINAMQTILHYIVKWLKKIMCSECWRHSDGSYL